MVLESISKYVGLLPVVLLTVVEPLIITGIKKLLVLTVPPPVMSITQFFTLM